MQFDISGDGVWPTLARAIIGFLVALVLFKIAKKRFMRGGTPFDTLLIVIVGAVLGRGIVEGDHFGSALAASAALVGVHFILAAAAFHVAGLSRLIEGHPRLLVRNGVIDRRQMRAALLKEEDVLEAARMSHDVRKMSDIAEARQERSGHISVVPFTSAERPSRR